MNNLRRKQQHTKGAALLIFVLLFLFASSAFTYLISKSIYADFVSYRVLTNSVASYYTAEASAEDVAYRYIAGGFEVDTTETLTIDDASAETDVSVDTNNNQLIVASEGDRFDAVRKVTITLDIGSGASFNFGVQTGNGGFEMANSSRVVGNVFSNGGVTGAGPSLIEGDIISASSGAFVKGVHATGSVHADNITNSTIDMHSYYYTSFTNNSPTGAVNGPGWPLEATSSLPFPDDKVDAHKATITAEIAASNGRHILSTDPECAGGEMTIDTSTTTGILKIDCDVVVDKNSTTWTVTDSVWIEGNLTFKSGPTIQATPVVSTTSVLIIVDNESDRTTSSQIDVQNGTIFSAPSSPKSYIMLLSMNDDAEKGGTNDAITMGQSSNGDVIVYAGHGKISLANQITLKEVTGYLIAMGQNSTIEYESGLINLNFTSGPGGGFTIGGWNEEE